MSSLLFFSPVLMAIAVGLVAQMDKGRTGAFYWFITVVLNYLIALGYLIATFAVPSDAEMIAMGHEPTESDKYCWPVGGAMAALIMLVVVATLPNRRRPTRRCPHCTKDILLAARVCKHCRLNVVGQDRAAQ